MPERAKLIIEHYPIHRLPEELQRGLDRDAVAKITIEPEEVPAPRSLTSFIGSARGTYAGPEHALEAIRQLRDEWE